MKNKKWLIPFVVIVIIATLWLTGIVPIQIAKISGTNYVKEHFPEMQLECIGVEYADVFGDYLIAFKDKGGNTYSCVIGPYLFPNSLGQGLFAIQDYYAENYARNEDTSALPEDATSFRATVLEVNENFLLVEPHNNSNESKSADKIEIPLADKTSWPIPAVGDTVNIYYSGGIQETYPARITKVHRVEIEASK